MNCQCSIHKHPVVHIYRKREWVYTAIIMPDSTAQILLAGGASPDDFETFDSALYGHGMSPDDLRLAALEPVASRRIAV